MKNYSALFFILITLFPSVVVYGNNGWDDFEKANYSTSFRAGYGRVYAHDREMNRDYGFGQGVLADIFLYRARYRKFQCWNGTGIYTRLGFRRFMVTDDEAVRRGMFRESKIDILSLDLGFRYSVGGFFLTQLFQFYIIAAPRVVSLSENAVDDNDVDVGRIYYAFGASGGAGFEFSIFTVTGLFIEYNYGYVPVGDDKSNIEGHQVYAGVVYRSRHGI